MPTIMWPGTSTLPGGSTPPKTARLPPRRTAPCGARVPPSLPPISDARLAPEQLRQLVRDRKAAGADLIKIFASRSIRDGGAQTLSDEQLAALCGRAPAPGPRP